MSKLYKMSISLIIAIALLLVYEITSANAQNNAAVVINPDGECFVGDSNGVGVSTFDTQIVITQSKNGITTLRCRAKGIFNDTGRAVRYNFDTNPVPCLIIGGGDVFQTEDWQEVLSPSGVATVICVLHPPF